MFASVMEEVEGKSGVKYTPREVAAWLDKLADEALKYDAPRQWAAGIRIQAGLGRFFAAKFRSALAYPHNLPEAIREYKAARDAWAKLANVAKDVYRPDVSFGYEYQLRGHWLDRLKEIDEDIARMEQLPAHDSAGHRPSGTRVSWNCRHSAPARFTPGSSIEVTLSVDDPKGTAAILHYRRVNQVERFVTAEMKANGTEFRGIIPGEYTKSPFPMQYYFELRGSRTFGMYPGLGPTLTNQPYFVIRQA